MASETEHPVVILYKHALLGEGIARYLLAQIGSQATVVSAHDLETAKSMLACEPAVVIFESSEPLQQVDLSTLAPRAILIDVSTVVTQGSAVSTDAVGLEQILQAVCERVAPSLAQSSSPWRDSLTAPAR